MGLTACSAASRDRAARKLRLRGSGTVALLALGLGAASCGTPQAAGPPSADAPTAASGAAPSSASAGTSWTADGDSFGVDRFGWPTTVAAAEPLVRRLPSTFDGRPRELAIDLTVTEEDGGSGASAGASYGDDTSVTVDVAYTTTDTEDGKPDLMTANDLLSASFGLGYRCAAGSYRGTATPLDDKVGPGSDDPPRPVWFSCRIDAAEGEESHTGHAVGWTSGTTAWQVLGRDAETVRALVTLVHDAAG